MNNIRGGAAGIVAPGECASGSLWRDLHLLGAGGRTKDLIAKLGRTSPFSPKTGGRENMKHLLNEFKGLYEGKLRHLGNKDESKDTLKMKVTILQSYVNDLGDQNEALIQMIEELEKLANEKISNLDNRLQKADQLLNTEVQENRVNGPETEHERDKSEAHRTALQERNEADVDHKSFQQEQHKVQNKTLKDQMKQIQQQYSETVEENGRLQARLEAWMITAQSEHEILSKEVFCKEDILHKLRMKQLSQDEKYNAAQEKIQHQEKLLKQLHQKYLTAVNVVENQQQMIQSLEQDLQTAMIAEKEMATGVAECEGTIKHLGMELSSLHSAQKLDNRTINQKKQIIHEMQQESNSWMQKLKDALCKIHQKEHKLGALEEELMEAKKQYSVCYEKFLHGEKITQQLKEETVELTDQIKQHSQDINVLSAEKQKIELEVTVITEKYRTAQHEVGKQDQIILKLKTDLETAQAKYEGAEEEIDDERAEVSRLNKELKDLQQETCKLRNIKNVQQDQLNRAGTSIQEFEHEQKMLLEEIQTIKKKMIKLHNDLDVTEQTYNDDFQRWSQKNTLLQDSLDATIAEFQDAVCKMQEYKTIGINLKEDLEKQLHLQHETTRLVEKHEDTIQKQKYEQMHLKEQIDYLQNKVTESHNQAIVSESTADLYKQKYQASTDRIHDLENHVRNLEEKSNRQVFEANQAICNLKADIVTLQRQYEEKCSQMETREEMIDQLSERLNGSQMDLQSNKDHIQQCEELIQRLNEEAHKMQMEIAEQDEVILQLQSGLAEYQINHGHSNEEYVGQVAHVDYLEKELESVKNVCDEKINRLGECERTILDLRAEITKSEDERKKCVLEVEKLDKASKTLQLNAAGSENKHNLELEQILKQITQLENDLADSQKSCNQMDQAIWKRDQLLQKLEAELQESKEHIKEKMSEVKDLDSVVADLQVELQDLQTHKIQTERENTALRTDVQQLNQELHTFHQQYREKAQELANQEEKMVLVESNLLAMEKQLNNKISEGIHQEQKQQQLHMQIKMLKEHLETKEEEMNKYKQEKEELRNELNLAKQHQEILIHHQDSQKTEIELGNAKEQIQALQQQVQHQNDLIRYLRDELNEEQNKYQEQQKKLVKLNHRKSELEAEVDNLRIKKQSEIQMMKVEEISYLQNKYYSICKELMIVKSQVKDLQLKLATEKEKTRSHNEEVEAQKQALEGAQSDNSRLHEESELMVSSVKQWIAEQGIANAILGRKIHEQNQLVSRLTLDNICLKEAIENLNQELKKVKNELEEGKNETEQIRATRNNSARQQTMLNQLRSCQEDQEHEQENLKTEKLAAIEDMHGRLKSSIESIELLHQQLHTLDGEYLKQSRQLKKEQTHRHRLELRSETCGQTILSHGAELKNQRLPGEQVTLPEGAVASDPTTLVNSYLGVEQISSSVPHKERGENLTRENLEMPDVTEPIIPDKTFWIQRLGDLSTQLQERTEYWTGKINESSRKIKHVYPGPSTK
ncbi:putative leucine-rich repeat-containing protein DDB_G0290503 isoform X3 [Leucoraja erinacea]|uniref:putative leucine-rich repeat-containing protein DDB_G0290503 isoform X3 n=1 Tax=Leucoraja erinaceus TaxID=7782 RepID=UPI002457105A|nr:putative leucine-rich repeat-containing protein DDB_G0290503 isoform X3 [Leucoraja erinacea]